jgi:hypothetical protein
MASTDILQPASALVPSTRQIWFLRYFTAILIDLVVLNLFVEYSKHVEIDSFTISVCAAVLLQILLKLTLALEHRLAAYFKARPGGFSKFLRWFSAWLVLFGSKFVILEAIDLAFGDEVVFAGPLHGLVVIIVVLFAMLLAEEVVVRIYRRLA